MWQLQDWGLDVSRSMCELFQYLVETLLGAGNVHLSGVSKSQRFVIVRKMCGCGGNEQWQ